MKKWKNKGQDNIQFKPNPDLKLMDQVREVLRYHHYAYRTEQSYCQSILRYIRFYGTSTKGVKHKGGQSTKGVRSLIYYFIIN